jgi:hypothetical protein
MWNQLNNTRLCKKRWNKFFINTTFSILNI